METGENAEVIHGVAAAFGMDAVEGETVGGEAVEPVEFAGHARAAFVGVEDVLAGELIADGGLEASEVVGAGFQGAKDDALADGVAEEILADPADALKGDVLLAVEIDQESQEPLSILGGGGDPGWERGALQFAAARTALGFGAVFGDVECGWGQFEDLAAFVREGGCVVGIECVAAGAGGEAEGNDLIGVFDRFERMSGMADLASGFASRASA